MIRKFILLSVFVFTILFGTASHAQLKQFQHNFKIGNNVPAAIIIVGYDYHKQSINQLLLYIEQEAKKAYNQLSSKSPGNEIKKLSRAKRGKYKIDSIVAYALSDAIDVSKWTEGAFDVSKGRYKTIDVNTEKDTVKFSKDKNKLNLDSIIEGVLADYMIGLAYSSNAANAINLTLGNVGVAAVSSTQFKDGKVMDPRTGKKKPVECRGVAVIMKDATMAQALANAIFMLGPDAGLNLINSLGGARGIIVDNKGRFLKSRGM